MKIIGIDIAIENLAFCGITVGSNIVINKNEWFVLDTTPEDYKHQCIYLNRKRCSKDAGWYYTEKEEGLKYYCATHKKIIDADKKYSWKTLNKNFINSNQVIKSIFNKLDEHIDYFRSADYIIIEKQPPKNPKMIAIMNYLYSYFVIRLWNDLEENQITLKDIIILDAKNKVNYCLEVLNKDKLDDLIKKYSDKTNKYQYYKKLSIETILQEETNVELLDYFNSHKKKDDLADSRNMVMWWIRKNSEKNKKEAKKAEKAEKVEKRKKSKVKEIN
jgi:hypothetical protein